MNNIDIKHKHSGHLIVIAGHSFKANEAGQWDLTEVWSTLKLPKVKQPGQWRTKEAARLSRMQFLHCAKHGAVNRVYAYKRAMIEYAAWVSPEFKDMVFDAFEAILEIPEVALLVADKMTELGYVKSAEILERSVFNDRCDWKSLARTPKRLTATQKQCKKLRRLASENERKDLRSRIR